jgi:hypothetical protein
MAAKQSHPLVRVTAVLFTSFVAPVLVSVVGNAVKFEENKPAADSAHPAVSDSHYTPAPAVTLLPPATVTPAAPVADAPGSSKTARFVVEGTGRTSEEALRDALKSALRVAGANPTTSPDSNGVILGWTELRDTYERKLLGTVHRKEVAVEVDRTAVRGRSRPAPTTGPFVWQPVSQ